MAALSVVAALVVLAALAALAALAVLAVLRAFSGPIPPGSPNPPARQPDPHATDGSSHPVRNDHHEGNACTRSSSGSRSCSNAKIPAKIPHT